MNNGKVVERLVADGEFMHAVVTETDDTTVAEPRLTPLGALHSILSRNFPGLINHDSSRRIYKQLAEWTASEVLHLATEELGPETVGSIVFDGSGYVAAVLPDADGN